MSISRQLSQYISKINYEGLPSPVIQAAKDAFLDWLGSAAAGAVQKPAQIMLSLIHELGGNGQATLISTGEKTSGLLAALGNGTSSHIVELDDVHKASILHAGSAIIPAALAAAEMVEADGKRLIEGIVVGYETAIRIGEAVTPAHYYYWHTTGTVGTFGAAAAAGKILGLTEEQLVHALGTAGTQAAGLWEFLADGAMSKHLHPGKSCLNGLLAALLAQKGFTAARHILEGEKGFIRATAQSFDLDKITRDLGQGYKILENSIKVHASCRHTHPAIDVVLDLVQKHTLTPEKINQIEVGSYPIAIDLTGNSNPDSLYAAKFSLPFCVALAAKVKKAGMNEFNLENLSDPVIRDLMAKVTLKHDLEVSALYPEKWPVIVHITDNDGHIWTGRTDYPQGDPENPVTKDQLEQKFRALASLNYDSEAVENLLRAINELEKVKDISAVLAKRKEV